MTGLCREYGISRKTGYKWLGRYLSEGAAGLRERSHAPLRHGQAHNVGVVQAVLELRALAALGSEEAAGEAEGAPSGYGSSGGEHDRRLAAARGFGRALAWAAPLPGLYPAVCCGGGGQ